MGFGPDARVSLATCRDCEESRACPCGCDRGWCLEFEEFVKLDDVFPVKDFDCFRPRMSYDPARYETEDPRIDMVREEG